MLRISVRIFHSNFHDTICNGLYGTIIIWWKISNFPRSILHIIHKRERKKMYALLIRTNFKIIQLQLPSIKKALELALLFYVIKCADFMWFFFPSCIPYIVLFFMFVHSQACKCPYHTISWISIRSKFWNINVHEAEWILILFK